MNGDAFSEHLFSNRFLNLRVQQQQAPSQAADPGAPNQAAAPGAPNQAAQPPPGKIELDFKTLGALAAALGVGTVKLPTAAPTQPAISQGKERCTIRHTEDTLVHCNHRSPKSVICV